MLLLENRKDFPEFFFSCKEALVFRCVIFILKYKLIFILNYKLTVRLVVSKYKMKNVSKFHIKVKFSLSLAKNNKGLHQFCSLYKKMYKYQKKWSMHFEYFLSFLIKILITNAFYMVIMQFNSISSSQSVLKLNCFAIFSSLLHVNKRFVFSFCYYKMWFSFKRYFFKSLFYFVTIMTMF